MNSIHRHPIRAVALALLPLLFVAPSAASGSGPSGPTVGRFPLLSRMAQDLPAKSLGRVVTAPEMWPCCSKRTPVQ
jgi:hypothetical protein